MVEMLLIFLLCFLLGGVALGHWMVYGDPDSKILALGEKIAGMSRLKRKPQIKIDAAVAPPHGWVAIRHNAMRSKRSKN